MKKSIQPDSMFNLVTTPGREIKKDDLLFISEDNKIVPVDNEMLSNATAGEDIDSHHVQVDFDQHKVYNCTDDQDENDQNTEIPVAMGILRKALKRDDSYAHSWHCNLAMMFYDAMPEIMDSEKCHTIANEGASRFMKLCFDVETSNDMLSEEYVNDDCNIDMDVPDCSPPEVTLKEFTNVVNIEEVHRFKDELTRINKMPLDDIVFMQNGEVIDIDQKIRDNWKLIGMNNVDFITSEFYLKGFIE